VFRGVLVLTQAEFGEAQRGERVRIVRRNGQYGFHALLRVLEQTGVCIPGAAQQFGYF
jgi:hypothetical protein